MLTYALGRGLEAYDVQAVDTIVERIQKVEGVFKTITCLAVR